MNKLGRAESYSFGLELETALATALEEASSLLTAQIIRNPSVPSLFHSDFDNFDQYINDISGSGSGHVTHSIMLQNIPSLLGSAHDDHSVIPVVPKTGTRSLKTLPDDSLPPRYISE
ncbi:MAG: hypothetical protein ACK5JN_18200, partial [Kluyvera sp.]|uniref:hypothetical protein n=1 Tax=Kluyvera sp. TaxID=1538228 RepID=UPI003A89E6E1